MNLSHVCNIEDLRTLARRRLPRIVRDFLEGGAEDQLTLRANRNVFSNITFAPRMLVNVSQRSQKVSIFGRQFDSVAYCTRRSKVRRSFLELRHDDSALGN